MRMPTHMRDTYEQSSFKLSRRTLYGLGTAHIAFSALFLWLLSTDNPEFLVIGFLYLLAGVVYYTLRRRLGIHDVST